MTTTKTAADTRPNTDSRWRSEDRRFAVHRCHLAAGWRYWAFEVKTGADEAVGLRVDGYDTMAAAQQAVAAVAGAAS